MGLALYCSVWGLNTICLLFRKNSKIITWISVIFFGVLFCTNPGLSGDAYYYNQYLQNPTMWSSYMDPGYAALVFIVRSLGIRSYGWFLLAVYILVFIFLSKAAKKLSVSVHPLIFVAMAYIFPFLSVVIRNAISAAILLYAMADFCTTKNKARYAIWVGIASLFHLSSVAFFLYLFAPGREKRRKVYSIKKLIVLLFVVGVALFVAITLFNGRRPPFERQIVAVLGFIFPEIGDRISYYMSTTTGDSFLAFYFIYFLQVVTTWYLSQRTNEMDENTASMVKTVHSVNVLLMVFLPFFLISTIFLRFMLVPCMLTVLCITKVLYVRNDGRQRRGGLRMGLMDLTLVLLTVSWFIVQLFGIFGVTIDGAISSSIFVR